MKKIIVLCLVLFISVGSIFGEGQYEQSGLNSHEITQTVNFKRAKFALITDLHMALNGKNGMKMGAYSVDIVKGTISDLNKINDLDFVVVTGDLLLDGEPWNLDLIKSYLNDLNVPYYVINGNHDYAPASQSKPDKDPYVAVDKSSFYWAFQGHGYMSSDGWWAVDPVPGLHLIGMDTGIPDSWGGHVSQSELQFLDEELGANRNKVNIVLSHHNFVPWSDDEKVGGKFYNFQVDNAAEVKAVFEKYTPSLQLVLSGHRHIGLRSKKVNGINYFVNPATVSYPNQYTLYTVTPEKVSFETRWVPVDKKIIEEAKANLLKADWWRPTGASDEEMLAFFEGEGSILKNGSVELDPVK